jgi:hypothetical protein
MKIYPEFMIIYVWLGILTVLLVAVIILLRQIKRSNSDGNATTAHNAPPPVNAYQPSVSESVPQQAVHTVRRYLKIQQAQCLLMWQIHIKVQHPNLLSRMHTNRRYLNLHRINTTVQQALQSA